ncbi:MULTISPECIES: BglG family transcription antiterminator [Robertmurraya]|nr:HTH domain-containing protein [Robertmurraya siralis]
MMLSAREFQLTNKLLNIKAPIRIKDLSTEFGVSTRTIKYDLENVRKWFKIQGLTVNSQTSKGIWIHCDERKRAELRRVLSQFKRFQVYPDQAMRVKRIILSLLLTNGYKTAAELSELLQVSRNTILSDLNHVDEFLTSSNVELERKPRIGYRLIGNELQLRLVLEHIVYNSLDDYQIYKMTTRITKQERQMEIGTVLERPLKQIYETAEKHMSGLYSPSLAPLLRLSDLLKFLLRLTFSVARLNLGHTINSYRVLERTQYKDELSLFLVSVMEKLYAEVQLPLLEEEFLYVSGNMEKASEQTDVVGITKKIIEYVSIREGIDYKKDPKLYSNLLSHLSLRLQNGSLYLNEINPMEDEVKRNHASLFQTVQEACRKFVKQHTLIAQDSFSSLIVLHFLVSYENTFKPKKKVKVLYVCSTGRGVARLIKNKVEKEIPAVDIVSYCSLLEVEEICQTEEVDLIISVFPVEATVPVIVVEPLPVKRDIEEIRKQVRAMIGSDGDQMNQLLENNDFTNSEDSESLSQEIILKGFEVAHALLEAFPIEKEENWKNAFMMHIFLMVHRYYFDKQYDQYLYAHYQMLDSDEEMFHRVQQILKEKDLHVHEAEIITVIQYLKKWK